MRLGEAVCISARTTDLTASLFFYERLGFEQVDVSTTAEHPKVFWLADGTLLLALQHSGINHTELAYFNEDISGKTEWLKEIGVEPQHTASGEVDFIDPSGLAVRLTNENALKANQPPGGAGSRCGRFYEVSIEVEDVDSTIAFWNNLGFEVQHREPPTSRWATLSDGVVKLGVYERGVCPHKFKNPALTYFEPDMSERIERLKQMGVEFIEELPNKDGKVNDAIAESPDGVYFFLFYYKWPMT